MKLTTPWPKGLVDLLELADKPLLPPEKKFFFKCVLDKSLFISYVNILKLLNCHSKIKCIQTKSRWVCSHERYLIPLKLSKYYHYRGIHLIRKLLSKRHGWHTVRARLITTPKQCIQIIANNCILILTTPYSTRFLENNNWKWRTLLNWPVVSIDAIATKL